jgi:hypothetical protein
MAYIIDIWKYGVTMSEGGYVVEEDTIYFDCLEDAIQAFEEMIQTDKDHENYSYEYEANLYDASTGVCLRTGWFN